MPIASESVPKTVRARATAGLGLLSGLTSSHFPVMCAFLLVGVIFKNLMYGAPQNRTDLVAHA